MAVMDNWEFDVAIVETDLAPVQYLAQHLVEQEVAVVGIYGPSGSGKSTFSEALVAELGEDRAVLLPVDSYWQYTRAQMAERQLTGYHWEARDKSRFLRDLAMLKRSCTIERPVFDYHNELPTDQTVNINPRDIIVLEDTLDLRNIVDCAVFTHAPDEVLIQRRLERDQRKSSFTTRQDLIDYIRNRSLPTYHRFLRPAAKHADYILDTSQSQLLEVL